MKGQTWQPYWLKRWNLQVIFHSLFLFLKRNGRVQVPNKISSELKKLFFKKWEETTFMGFFFGYSLLHPISICKMFVCNKRLWQQHHHHAMLTNWGIMLLPPHFLYSLKTFVIKSDTMLLSWTLIRFYRHFAHSCNVLLEVSSPGVLNLWGISLQRELRPMTDSRCWIIICTLFGMHLLCQTISFSHCGEGETWKACMGQKSRNGWELLL